MLSRLVAVSLAGLSTFVAGRAGGDGQVGFAVVNLVALSMILKPGWWAFWLPFGFLEQLASDKHLADRQGPAIAFLGWLIVLGALLGAFFL